MNKSRKRRKKTIHPYPAAGRVWRMRIVAFAIILAFLLLNVKLFKLQILEGEKYAQKARGQQTKRVPLESRRGSILDRSGNELAVDLPQQYTIGVHPKQVKNSKILCQELAGFTGRPSSHYHKRLQTPSKFIYLEWRLSQSQAERLNSLNIGGLTLKKTTGRFYPYNYATSQILGYTDVDGRGIAGLELHCEDILQGRKGWETHQRDARGTSFWDPLKSYALPRDGGTVRLSLDIVAQEVLRYELVEILKKHRAQWAGGILMNPTTGEILAMSSVPDFDPSRPESGSQANHKLRPMTDLIEPGSVFKIVPAAAALDKDKISSTDSIYCENGAYRIGPKTLRDVHKYDWLTFEDVLVFSSNIGMAKVAETIGSKELYRFATRFGFSTPTGLEFPGEASGILRAFSDWKPIDRANVAMGQGVSATMLQVAFAFAAIANDGILMEPRLILNYTDPAGRHNSFPPREVRRVIEPQTARQLQQILTQAVERGTGMNASIEGMDIAGKTGTAQLPDLVNGGYHKDRFIASFVGFMSAQNADRLLIIAVCDPKGGHFGSQVAAPVFKKIIQRLKPADAIRKSWKVSPIELASVSGTKGGVFSLSNLTNALNLFRDESYSNIFYEPVDIAIEESPTNIVPELKGLSIREATHLLSKCGLKFEIDGTGWIVSQSLRPGTPVKQNAICRLKAKP